MGVMERIKEIEGEFFRFGVSLKGLGPFKYQSLNLAFFHSTYVYIIVKAEMAR
jgi:hypothetical protein